MDEFATMMQRQGVKPIVPPQPTPKPTPTPTPARVWHPGEQRVMPAKLVTVAIPAVMPRWSVGAEGLAQVSGAIARMIDGERHGSRSFITYVDMNGHTARSNLAPAATTAEKVIAEADRLKARVVIIGGPGWTCVMHPLAGATTIARDPVGEPA